MLRADFHTHTTYCDGENTPREMVEAACRMGYTDFGFSSHADCSFCVKDLRLSGELFERYKAELSELKDEYAGKINLYIGVELDCIGPVLEAEYTIGSTHFLYRNGEYIAVDKGREFLTDAVQRLWNGDWYAFARDYFELESNVYDRTHCDIVGHFDLLTKFNEGYVDFDESCDAYLEPALAAMKKLNSQGLPFEINTGAISRGFRTQPYPNKILLKELRNMGGRIMINSDCHRADHIGFCFDQAARLAAECGFTHTLVLAPGGGFREVEL